MGDFSSLNTGQLVALGPRRARSCQAQRASGRASSRAARPPIYFAGDSTAAGPEWAWATYHVTSPRLRTLSEYQVGSGLVVPSYFDWPHHLLAVVGARRPRLVIYMGSANERIGNCWSAAHLPPVGSPAWRAEYAARVGSVMTALLREGAKVLWIGEPAMQDPQLSADMRVIDQVCAEEAAKHPGVTFLNPGVILNGPGSYTATVTIDGHPTQVRLDGIHLNIAGSIYVADYLAPIVDRILGDLTGRGRRSHGG